MTKKLNPPTKIAVFRQKKIRKTLHNNAWWFVIVDVFAALTDTAKPHDYVKDLRKRMPKLGKGWSRIAKPLPIQTAGGVQSVYCANTEGLLRLIQSIPQRHAAKTERFRLQLMKMSTVKKK